jgi:hypothetical protein
MFLFLLCVLAVSRASFVQTLGARLTLDGETVVVKGSNYSPRTVGQSKRRTNNKGDVGRDVDSVALV